MRSTGNPQINTPAYWDEVYVQERGSGKERIDAERLEFVCSHLPEEGKFLDIGCGNAELLAKVHTRFPHLQLTGLDISNGTIANAMLDHPEMSFVVGSAEALPFANYEFDAVFCGETIEHTSDPERVFHELRRITRYGGVYMVSTPLKHRNRSPEHTFEFELMDFVQVPGLIDLDVVCNGISMIGCWRQP